MSSFVRTTAVAALPPGAAAVAFAPAVVARVVDDACGGVLRGLPVGVATSCPLR
jgi:hypothetical protein